MNRQSDKGSFGSPQSSSNPKARPRKLRQHTSKRAQARRAVPRWDAKSGELWLGDKLLKRFHQPAPNQRALLDGFAKARWAHWIADPIPALSNPKKGEAEARLNDTVSDLNGTLPARTLHFECDGTGHGIRWRFADE